MNLPDPLLGTVIDERYRIDTRLASGGMASVYQAMNVRLRRPVAVKVIHPHLAEQPDFAARFIQEARAAAALASPNIVSVYDQGVISTGLGERAYLVMELVTGPDLRSELRLHGSFKLGDALAITHQVLSALAAAHAKGIVHRDVKPENILLTHPVSWKADFTPAEIAAPAYTAKVADFGLARAVSDATSTHSGQMLGTVAYVAPEIVMRGHAQAPADIYATGIMLYELIAGVQPYVGESPVAVAYAHVNEPMPQLAALAPWIPPQLDDLIAHFTAKDPTKRPADGQAALAELVDLERTLPAELLTHRIPVLPAMAPAAPTQSVAVTPAAADTADNTSTTGTASGDATAPIAQAAEAASTLSGEPADAESAAGTERLASTESLAHAESAENAASTAHSALAATPATQADTATIVTPAVPVSSVTPTTNPFPPLRSIAASPLTASASAPEQLASVATAANTDAVATSAANSFSASDVPAKRRHRKKPWLIALLILVILGVLGGGGYWWFTAGPGWRVTVPAVAGQSLADAQAALKKAGFESKAQPEFSDEIEKGLVIATDPPSGSKIHPSQIVTIRLSKGVEYLTVPKVTGISSSDAQDQLTQARFKPRLAEDWSQDVPKGTVISQDPAADSSAPHDSFVTIVVSKGKEPLKVPDQAELNGDDYEKLLRDTGFDVSRSEEFSDAVASGALISVNPEPGTQLYRGDTVTIVVSKGPELVAVPNVMGKQQGEARKILEAAGFKVKLEKILGGYFGTVRMQDPDAGTMAKKGSTITLTVV